MLSGNGEPGSLFGWPFSSLINRSRHNSTRAWRATANNTTLQSNLQIPHWLFVISVSMLMRSDSSKGQSRPTCRRSDGAHIIQVVWGKTETAFPLWQLSCAFMFCINAVNHLETTGNVFIHLEQSVWMDQCGISKVYLLHLIIIWHVGDILIREARVNIWLLKMFWKEHGGFACCMFMQSHTSAPGPSLAKPCCGTWALENWKW